MYVKCFGCVRNSVYLKFEAVSKPQETGPFKRRYICVGVDKPSDRQNIGKSGVGPKH